MISCVEVTHFLELTTQPNNYFIHTHFNSVIELTSTYFKNEGYRVHVINKRIIITDTSDVNKSLGGITTVI